MTARNRVKNEGSTRAVLVNSTERIMLEDGYAADLPQRCGGGGRFPGRGSIPLSVRSTTCFSRWFGNTPSGL